MRQSQNKIRTMNANQPRFILLFTPVPFIGQNDFHVKDLFTFSPTQFPAQSLKLRNNGLKVLRASLFSPGLELGGRKSELKFNLHYDPKKSFKHTVMATSAQLLVNTNI